MCKSVKMRVALVVLVAIVTDHVAVTSPIRGFPHHDGDSMPLFECPPLEHDEWLLPDPVSCEFYVVCEYADSIWQRIQRMPCPQGLVFNRDLHVCDYRSNVDCSPYDGNPRRDREEQLETTAVPGTTISPPLTASSGVSATDTLVTADKGENSTSEQPTTSISTWAAETGMSESGGSTESGAAEMAGTSSTVATTLSTKWSSSDGYTATEISYTSLHGNSSSEYTTESSTSEVPTVMRVAVELTSLDSNETKTVSSSLNGTNDEQAQQAFGQSTATIYADEVKVGSGWHLTAAIGNGNGSSSIIVDYPTTESPGQSKDTSSTLQSTATDVQTDVNQTGHDGIVMGHTSVSVAVGVGTTIPGTAGDTTADTVSIGVGVNGTTSSVRNGTKEEISSSSYAMSGKVTTDSSTVGTTPRQQMATNSDSTTENFNPTTASG